MPVSRGNTTKYATENRVSGRPNGHFCWEWLATKASKSPLPYALWPSGAAELARTIADIAVLRISTCLLKQASILNAQNLFAACGAQSDLTRMWRESGIVTPSFCKIRAWDLYIETASDTKRNSKPIIVFVFTVFDRLNQTFSGCQATTYGMK